MAQAQLQVEMQQDKISSMAIKAWVFAFLAFSLDLMDWTLLAFTAPEIIKELKFTKEGMGVLLGAPLIGAGIGGILSGWLADKVGRVKAMSLCLFWFSSFTVLFPFAPDFTWMFTLRILAGLGLGAQWGVGSILAAEYVPTNKRILASATIQSGAAFGPLAAAMIASAIIPSYGWRPVFYSGAMGFVLAILALVMLREPEVWVHAREKAKAGVIKLADFRRLLEPTLLRRGIACFFLIEFVLWAYWGSMSWIPTWLVTTKGMGIVKSMNYMVILNIGGAIGFLLFGLIADRWGRKPPAYAALIASIFAVIAFVSIDDPKTLLICAPFYAAITYPVFGLFGGYMSELFPTEIRGTAVNGIYNLARLLSFLSPFVLAWVSSIASLTVAIGGTAALYLLAVIKLLTLPETKKIKSLKDN
jgi:MFS family permease